MGKNEVLYEYVGQTNMVHYDYKIRSGTHPNSLGMTLWASLDDLILFSDCLTLTIL